jgi:hypothetical protein
MMADESRAAMRQISIAILICTVTGIGLSQPKISVDKTKIDMGIVYNGAVKKARATIRNNGSDTLRILGVSTSCGCTTARQPKDFLRPGESDFVEVEFNSTGFRGQVEKHLEIQSNDPKNPRLGITLTVDVIEELLPVNNASVVWLGTVPIGKTVEQVIGLKNVSGKVITLTGFKSSSPDLTADLANRRVMPADTIRISIKITPRKSDYISETLLLGTDSNKQSQVPIRITLLGVTPN